jgi:hypothetical protein
LAFLDHIIVRPLLNGIDWELQREVRYATNVGDVIYIPAGFITDFASIPWFFRRIFQPATGKHRRAAVVHDWLYRTSTEPYTKEKSDLIFLEIMKDDGVSKMAREVLYNSVKFGGSSSYVRREDNG